MNSLLQVLSRYAPIVLWVSVAIAALSVLLQPHQTVLILIIAATFAAIGSSSYAMLACSKAHKELESAAANSSQEQAQAAADLPGLLSQLGVSLRNARQEAAYANQRYRILTENIVAGIVLRSPSGEIVFANSYMEVLTGYSLREIYAHTGDFLGSIVHKDDLANYSRALKFAEVGEAFQGRFRIVHSSGLQIWLESRTVPVEGESGQIELVLSVLLDVTGNVRYQQQIEEKNQDLYDFSYMISHDLKAPIATIKGMLYVMQHDRKEPLAASDQELFEHVNKAVKRLEQLVASVLEYARVSSSEINLESINLEQLLGEIQTELAQSMQQCGGEIELLLSGSVVSGDRLRLYQVFTNLFSNAIKYRDPSRPPHIRVVRQPSNRHNIVRIEVSDNGLGIPDDKLEVIFRPFQRIHREMAEGSGIGLASVKRIMERLGGSVSVRSTVGTGSTFVLELPSGA